MKKCTGENCPMQMGYDFENCAAIEKVPVSHVARYRRRPDPEHDGQRAGRGAVRFPDGYHRERPLWCFDDASRLA